MGDMNDPPIKDLSQDTVIKHQGLLVAGQLPVHCTSTKLHSLTGMILGGGA